MTKRNITTIIVFAAVILFIYSAYAFDLPKWFPFNRKSALKEWQEKIFKGRVLYVVESKKKEGYLLARSQESCSGLFHRIKFDAKKFPIMSWNWKVTKFPEKRNPAQQKGGWLEKDDYAARVYVIFAGWNMMNIKSLEYIWDERLLAETILTSPYSKNIKLIVAQSGKTNPNEWVFEKRNIFNDFKKAFGYPPNKPVYAIALMTDADNTISTAEAHYKNIKVGYNE